MKLHDLQPPKGAKKERRRVGRGTAAGQGTYGGRGRKGQKARSGGTKAPYFEGGQLPLVRRLPHKRGFVNIFRVEYAEVNVDRLEQAFEAGTEVTPAVMAEVGLIKSANLPVKVLGRGELTKALTVEAHRFSAGARLKIEAAGGSIRELE
jgi:large subunit ribosomal protein L15